MVEVLFGESEAGAMKAAMRGGKLGTDAVCLGFALDVGNIREPVESKYRAKLLYNLLYVPQWGADSEIKKELKQLGSAYCGELNRLDDHLKSGEPIRVWYSSAPYSICGLMWLCARYRKYSQTRDIYTMELPHVVIREDGTAVTHASWGEVVPDEFERLLPLQKRISPIEITLNAAHWDSMQSRNAPLRAVVNGAVMSVPASFYDFLIWKYLGDEPVVEARLIGSILAENPLGVGDYWYAQRIDKLIEKKRISIIENSPRKYERLITKSRF